MPTATLATTGANPPPCPNDVLDGPLRVRLTSTVVVAALAPAVAGVAPGVQPQTSATATRMSVLFMQRRYAAAMSPALNRDASALQSSFIARC